MDANTEAFATKADLVATKQDLEQKIHNLEVQMAGHRSAIIYWMIGIFFGTFTLAGLCWPCCSPACITSMGY